MLNELPGLVSSTFIPEIIWHQSDVKVVIRIMLCDIEDYYLGINDDRFIFSTKLHDKEYFVSMKLYGAIIAENTRHINLGREIRILMEKGHKWLAWPRLQLGTERNALIMEDPDSVNDHSWDLDSKLKAGIGLGGRGVSFAEYKRINNIGNIHPAGLLDECESEDEMVDKIFD